MKQEKTMYAFVELLFKGLRGLSLNFHNVFHGKRVDELKSV